MFTKNFIDLSVVRLKDGRIGTVVHIYPDEETAIAEISETNELVDIVINDVTEIIWTP